MSLWSKSVESITFEDVNNFLLQKHREGLRLDYKADLPKKLLAKLVCAFANTNGGLIILGVESDPATNQPVWPTGPPKPGLELLAFEDGIQERITSICQDNIYPPLLPQLSSPIRNPNAPDKALVVVRVDESPEAPHATDSGRRIYERTGAQNDPIDFAHIDRIKQLLDRRRRIEEEREALIQRAIKRASHQLGLRHLKNFVRTRPDGAVSMEGAIQMFIPLRWVSVIPYYPLRELCSTDECYARHRNVPNTSFVQRVPGGTQATAGVGHYVADSSARSMFSTRGHVFFIERVREAEWDVERKNPLPASSRNQDEFWLGFDMTFELVKTTAKAARGFYRGIELPGHLMLSVGYIDVRDFKMTPPGFKGGEESSLRLRTVGKFPDETFRAEVVFTASDFLSFADGPFAELFDQVTDGFDLMRLPPDTSWRELLA